MDRLVDHLFVFEGDGVIRDFPGNYSQYRQSVLKPVTTGDENINEPILKQSTPVSENSTPVIKKQLSYKEKREFELLEKEIKDLTNEKAMITEKLNSGNTPFDELQTLSLRIGQVTQLLDEKELRWLELSEL
jgi:ABC transport system ATP-binding/permease protein